MMKYKDFLMWQISQIEKELGWLETTKPREVHLGIRRIKRKFVRFVTKIIKQKTQIWIFVHSNRFTNKVTLSLATTAARFSTELSKTGAENVSGHLLHESENVTE